MTTRREFLRAASAAAILSPPLLRGQSDKLGPLLPQRQLGITGEKVTAMGLGGHHVGAARDKKIVEALIERAMETGVRFFDNAVNYQEAHCYFLDHCKKEGYQMDACLMPVKWKIVEDPVDEGTVLMTDDPAAKGGKYGSADIVTKKEYRDFRLHLEFLVNNKGGNSGVYLQNRFEIQIKDGAKTKHGMGAVINESEAPYHLYKGQGTWNAYDIVFRAARSSEDGKMTEKPRVTMYFNNKKAHKDIMVNQVWGGPNSGLDGGNDGGKGITDRPGGLKLQSEGHDVRYRNIWIKKLDLGNKDTDF